MAVITTDIFVSKPIKMFKQSILRQTARAARAGRPVPVKSFQQTITPYVAPRGFKTTPYQQKDTIDKKVEEVEQKTEHAGTYSRTDNTIQIEHPNEDEYPAGKPVQGRGGYHFKRTLANFSLEGGVGLVTGGARGLGLVMSQALVVSGADVAIVDLNSE